MRFSHLLGAALLLASPNAFAETAVIHKWVDGDGVTHYSDAAPPAPATPVARIELPPAATSTSADARDDYYSIANQWRRMHAERLALERIHAERIHAERVRAQRESARAGRETRQVVQVEINPVQRGIALLPRHVSLHLRPQPHPRRHPQALPGRDWPIGLHPGRLDLRGGYEPP